MMFAMGLRRVSPMLSRLLVVAMREVGMVRSPPMKYSQQYAEKTDGRLVNIAQLARRKMSWEWLMGDIGSLAISIIFNLTHSLVVNDRAVTDRPGGNQTIKELEHKVLLRKGK
jgi:hypothetical protein